MKRGTQQVVFAGFIVAALVLASCRQAPPPVQQTTTPTQTTQTKAPTTKAVPTAKYGGTLSFAMSYGPLGWDDAVVDPWYAWATHYMHVNEELLTGDWSKGAAGTGEAAFQIGWTLLPQFEVGALAEKWQMPDDETIIFTIRKGIRWQNKAPTNGREVVADDVAFSIERNYASATSYHGKNTPPEDKPLSAKATDAQTVVVKTPKGKNVALFTLIAELLSVYPRDAVQQFGDLNDWKNSIGTGPFMVKDYVEGSAVTLEKNPNYWMKDPVRPNNTLPYLDKVVALIIPDASTRTSALRTGQIDYMAGLSLENATSLKQTNPQLKSAKFLSTSENAIYWRTDKPELPYKDIKVRRALMMGANLPAIIKDYYSGEAEMLTLPIATQFPEIKDMHFPIASLDAETRKLFEYRPDEAKQLLADAGYPTGFKARITCLESHVDLLSIVKDSWSKIGVDLTLEVKEYGSYSAIAVGRTHEEMFIWTTGNTAAYRIDSLKPENYENWSMVNDPRINAQYTPAENAALDWPKLVEIQRGILPYIYSQAYYMGLGAPYVYTFWQPRLKNFNGELFVGFGNSLSFFPYVWVED